ncbi:ABC transporter ATP-binding protein [Kovacikia minuta CCNUW1]|uniref:ABC transporter ATP-binding protein n=1 Tax=Kovacikia minuta TaxID=2931930 RepID=UPI001CCD3C79|nr:ABC transporter ATP-binding protein [Kovacikia minuta]UBF24680.1 ABC transporter ATP-binding protein [Kovacikia minuta CCNUW1]
MEPIISARGLGKSYQIRTGERKRYHTLRDDLIEAARNLTQGKWGRSPTEEFWALKDIDLDIYPGEVVGIIGRNGAGKSTLLKILSRVVQPTTGEAALHGRVASLLEVGTGFHPELTGRENIFMSGAVLGMQKAEIRRKFDEIVAFAEVEKFLDTPVKRYSSGMYVRLAFAVAAHLEPDILLVDEVLAVGDAAFQKKCLGRMEDVATKGRTVLFVSHNMSIMQSLCEKTFLLDKGKLIEQGSTSEVINHYLQSEISKEVVPLTERNDRSGDGSVRLTFLEIESTDEDKIIRSNSRLKLTIHYRSENDLLHPQFLVGIYDYSNTGIFLLDSDAVGKLPESLPAVGSVSCITDPINMTPGQCYVNVALLKGKVMADYIQYAAQFDVEFGDIYESGKVPPRSWVMCVLKHEWSIHEN